MRRLAAHGYDLLVDPVHGASLAALRWQRADGSWFDLLEPCPPAEIARSGGSFVMAPFANRLDGGRFEVAGAIVNVPLNRPDLNLAIHGFSRDRQWQVADATETTLTLFDDFADPAVAFAYRLTQRITIGPEGVELTLDLANTARRPLPYGFGFHPWFRKDDATWLTIGKSGVLGRDARGLPTEPIYGPALAAGRDTSSMPWFDGHLIDWAPRQALIEWPRAGIRLRLGASGALTNLHVYVPDDRPVLCVEPVSHVPDVHNRRHLAHYGDLAWLAPGETMRGAMQLRAGASDLRIASKKG